jgi:hypothetical protein
MEFLSEDATYLAGGLAVLAAIFLVALKLSQQGKFLIWALAALGLAGLVLLVEWLWVTDTERIEQVVYRLRRAVAHSDAPAVIAELAPDIRYSQSGLVMEGDDARGFIESQLEKVRFDFVRITQLRAQAFPQSRRGKAEFRVVASGSYQSQPVTLNFGTTNLDFSLGFREAAPKTWRVERINLTRAPRDMPVPGGGGTRPRYPGLPRPY